MMWLPCVMLKYCLFALVFCYAFLWGKRGLVCAHSNLAEPLPTRELHCRVGSQQGRDCPGPCPRLDDYGRLNLPVSPRFPAATWQRGETVRIRWHRDNHDGTGFVRLSLVPVDAMMDKGVHERLAFHYSCMNSGLHRCENRSYDVCGNDAAGLAWQGNAAVPTTHDDGVYVLGWSWYGGGDFRGRSFFGDYYSCSFVRVRGGKTVTETYTARFASGNGVCVSAVDRLGVCESEPCRVGRTAPMPPREFADGSAPVVRRADVLRAAGRARHLVDATLPPQPRQGEVRPVVTPAELRLRKDNKGGNHGLQVAFLDLRTFQTVPVRDGGVYHVADFPRGLTVEAFYTRPDVRFIDFYIDGALIRRERHSPFLISRNDGPVIYRWDMPLGRAVKIQVSVVTRHGDGDRFEADVLFN